MEKLFISFHIPPAPGFRFPQIFPFSTGKIPGKPVDFRVLFHTENTAASAPVSPHRFPAFSSPVPQAFPQEKSSFHYEFFPSFPHFFGFPHFPHPLLRRLLLSPFLLSFLIFSLSVRREHLRWKSLSANFRQNSAFAESQYTHQTFVSHFGCLCYLCSFPSIRVWEPFPVPGIFPRSLPPAIGRRMPTTQPTNTSDSSAHSPIPAETQARLGAATGSRRNNGFAPAGGRGQRCASQKKLNHKVCFTAEKGLFLCGAPEPTGRSSLFGYFLS